MICLYFSKKFWKLLLYVWALETPWLDTFIEYQAHMYWFWNKKSLITPTYLYSCSWCVKNPISTKKMGFVPTIYDFADINKNNLESSLFTRPVIIISLSLRWKLSSWSAHPLYYVNFRSWETRHSVRSKKPNPTPIGTKESHTYIRPRGYKTLSMLNSTKHEIYPAHIYFNIYKHDNRKSEWTQEKSFFQHFSY